VAANPDLYFVIRSVMPFEIASGPFNSFVNGLCRFAGRAANVAFVTIPCTPHTAALFLFDMNRIPDTPFGIIVLMDFFDRHRTSFWVAAPASARPEPLRGGRLTFALKMRTRNPAPVFDQAVDQIAIA
jgi:hypothetical protein